MATIIDALVITLGLDSKGVSKGMQEASTTLDSGVKNIASQIIAPLSALLAGAFAGGAIIQRFVDAADLGKLSRQLRVGVEDLQAWQGAAIEAGGSAQGLVESAKALQQTTGSRLPITDQLLRLSDQMRGMSEMRSLELGKKMGMDEGTIKLLRQGRQAVQDMVNQQKELVAFSKHDVEMLNKVKQGYNGLRGMIFSVSNLVVKLFLPAMHWMSEKMRASSGVFPEMRKKMGLVSQWISENTPHILNAFGAIAAIVTARMVPAMLRLALSMLPFLPFILIIGGLVLLFDDLMTYINGGESELEAFWQTFGTGPELAAALGEAWEQLKTVGLTLWTGLKEAAAEFFGYFPGQLEHVKSMFSGLIKAVVALFKGDFEGVGVALRQIFDGAVEYIMGLLTGIVNFIKDKFSLDGITSSIGGAWDAVKSVGKGFMEGEGTQAASPATTVRPDAVRAGGSSVQTETNIQKIEVVTQATDAAGIARDMGAATRNTFNANGALVGAANSGVAQK